MKVPGYEQKITEDKKVYAQKKAAKTAAAKAEKAEKIRAGAQKLKDDKKAVIKQTLKKRGDISVGKNAFDTAIGAGLGAVQGTVAASGLLIAAQAAALVFGTAWYMVANLLDSNDMESTYYWMDFSEEPAGWHEQSYASAMNDMWFMNDIIGASSERFLKIAAAIVVLGFALHIGVKVGVARSAQDQKKINELYKYSELLKNTGLTQRKILKCYSECGYTLLAKMSEMDRGYIENLLSGGLNNANFETAVAIIEGHLKSHPNDYAEIISIIDEATLPPEIVKKYGKGKTVSFGAAMAMNNINQNKK